jgi:hypothetical protein
VGAGSFSGREKEGDGVGLGWVDADNPWLLSGGLRDDVYDYCSWSLLHALSPNSIHALVPNPASVCPIPCSAHVRTTYLPTYRLIRMCTMSEMLLCSPDYLLRV